MASSQNNFNFPHSPPPPHVIPPPPPPPPSSPDSDSTVVVVVFVSFGCLFFLAFLLVALCCFMKRKKKTVQETDIVRADEHMKMKEAVVPGPHGAQAVVLTIEDDVHIEEEITKNEKLSKGMHEKSKDNIVRALGTGEPSSGSGPHNDEHKP